MKVHKLCTKHLKRVGLATKNNLDNDNLDNSEKNIPIHKEELSELNNEQLELNFENNEKCEDILCETVTHENTQINTCKKEYVCVWCVTKLSSNKNLWRHKQTCKFKDNAKQINQIKEDFTNIKNDLMELINIIKPDQINPRQPNKVLKLVKNLTGAKQADVMSKILLSSFGIVYFVQPEQYLNTNVYKIGMSDKPLIDRIKAYGSQSRVIFLIECNMAYELEQEIVKVFKQKFKLHKGKEYFEGTEFEMTSVFMQLCVTHKLTNCIGKDTVLLNSSNNQENYYVSQTSDPEYNDITNNRILDDDELCKSKNPLLKKMIYVPLDEVIELTQSNINLTQQVEKIINIVENFST
jgi:hypothetical protein